MKLVKNFLNFAKQYHKTEIAVFFITLLTIGSVIFFTYKIYKDTQDSKQLIASGKNHVQAEEFNLALSDFRRAADLSQVDLFGLKFSLSQDANSEIVKTQKLIKSHEHLILGLQLYNKKLYDKAAEEFKKVDSFDPEFELAKTKLVDAQNNYLEEQKAITEFNTDYERATTACNQNDYKTCITYSNLALNLTNEDLQLDQTRIDALKKLKISAIQELEKIKQQQAFLAKAYKLQVPILMYHYIRNNPDPNDKIGFNLSVTPSDFEAQMKYLADNGYNTVDVQTVEKALKKQVNLPSKPIVLTFDDGYRDFYTSAWPILKKYNLHAEIYIATGLLGGVRFLTWEMLKDLKASGLVTIGAHTVNHVSLTAQKLDKLNFELTQSKKDLETNLGTTVTDFCYPYGSVNSTVIKAVEKAGYTNATTTVFGRLQIDGYYFTMPRVRVSGGETLNSFIARL